MGLVEGENMISNLPSGSPRHKIDITDPLFDCSNLLFSSATQEADFVVAEILSSASATATLQIQHTLPNKNNPGCESGIRIEFMPSTPSAPSLVKSRSMDSLIQIAQTLQKPTTASFTKEHKSPLNTPSNADIPLLEGIRRHDLTEWGHSCPRKVNLPPPYRNPHSPSFHLKPPKYQESKCIPTKKPPLPPKPPSLLKKPCHGGSISKLGHEGLSPRHAGRRGKEGKLEGAEQEVGRVPGGPCGRGKQRKKPLVGQKWMTAFMGILLTLLFGVLVVLQGSNPNSAGNLEHVGFYTNSKVERTVLSSRSRNGGGSQQNRKVRVGSRKEGPLLRSVLVNGEKTGLINSSKRGLVIEYEESGLHEGGLGMSGAKESWEEIHQSSLAIDSRYVAKDKGTNM